MKNNCDLVDRLNNAISEINIGVGPSQTNLILHGPIDRNLISKENLDILKSNEKLFKDNYNNFIFPKIREIVRVITQDNSDFPKTKKELDNVFKYRTPEEVRKKIRNSYKGQFELDSITDEHLFSDEKITHRSNKGKRFYFDENSEYIFSKRYKFREKIIKKLGIKFGKMVRAKNKHLFEKKQSRFKKLYRITKGMIRAGKDDVLDFAVNAVENNYNWWNNYSEYAKIYSEEELDMMLGDLFSIKITDLNQKRAEKNMDRIVRNYKKADFHNFSLVEKRFDDHRWRNKEGRPGGIHCTLVDKMWITYPIEIHYLGIKDECANLFGEHADYLYELNGKKSNPLTGD